VANNSTGAGVDTDGNPHALKLDITVVSELAVTGPAVLTMALLGLASMATGAGLCLTGRRLHHS
jgi:hypothetical protein